MPTLSQTAFSRYQAAIRDFSSRLAAWSQRLPQLGEAQRELQNICEETDYALETPIVYNGDLDRLRPGSNIRWILIADNPGKKEQLAENRRYLVGSSGKAAENFFRQHLDIDFRSEVLIINKSPVHTPKTSQLRRLLQIYPDLRAVFIESQCYMADFAWQLYSIAKAPIWLMGLSELQPRGLFSAWYERFSTGMPAREAIFVFKHFSMGSFASDLKKRRLPDESVEDAVHRIGTENRLVYFPEPQL
ncbi:MAG: hypothetical protein KKI09_08220 [Spirochaetes bacterium]|nr:hypothetical protein [Spirochaetota bacterium]MBU0955397.1 hypothetical protein [Spirochaetota bacterium]